MTKVLKLNSISSLVGDVFGEKYEITAECDNPDLILVRSAAMAEYPVNDNLIAVGRAGAGVNNIPHADYVKRGIVVFNTPGANANAVKELVLSALFMSGRKLTDGIAWAQSLKGKGDEVKALVEKGKGQFVGCEIIGKTLGVIGLGAIGRLVSESAIALGMSVVGFDTYLADNIVLSTGIKKVDTLEELYSVSDFITVHVPFMPATKGFINETAIAKMKDGVAVINAARGELVENSAMLSAIESGKVSRYFTDFPTDELLGVKNVIPCPHLGASTPEAEDNCAVMVANQLKAFVEEGNIVNSVNFPALSVPKTQATRITVLADGEAGIIEKITALFAEKGITVQALHSAARGGAAYYIIDVESLPCDCKGCAIAEIEGVYRVRIIK